MHFYPRSPRGERPPAPPCWSWTAVFLSTLPAWGATFAKNRLTSRYLFLSTLPARGATLRLVFLPDGQRHFYPRSPRGERPKGGGLWAHVMFDFYPRSPRGERRVTLWRPRCSTTNFYPRSPRGERRPAGWRSGWNPRHFYPRSPRGERHDAVFIHLDRIAISIHAPREGSDGWPRGTLTMVQHFYPRSPRGERPGPGRDRAD